jgi:hypothetical protein
MATNPIPSRQSAPTPSRQSTNDKVEVPAVEARQGVISGRVLLVLATSVLLAAIALGLSYCGAVG